MKFLNLLSSNIRGPIIMTHDFIQIKTSKLKVANNGKSALN